MHLTPPQTARLNRLLQLYQEGALSPEEFNRARDKVIRLAEESSADGDKIQNLPPALGSRLSLSRSTHTPGRSRSTWTSKSGETYGEVEQKGWVYYLKKTSVFSTAIMFTAGIVFTVSASNSETFTSWVNTLQTLESVDESKASPTKGINNGFILPIFGPQAIQHCSTRCLRLPRPSQQVCQSTCRKFSLEDYPKRIEILDADYTVDSQRIIARCLDKPIQKSSKITKAEITAKQEQARARIQKHPSGKPMDFGTSRLEFTQMYRLANSTPSPVSEKAKDVDRLVRTSCLRANYKLVEMGLSLARQRQDSFNSKYYEGLRRALLPVVQKWERTFLRNTKGKTHA